MCLLPQREMLTKSYFGSFTSCKKKIFLFLDRCDIIFSRKWSTGQWVVVGDNFGFPIYPALLWPKKETNTSQKGDGGVTMLWNNSLKIFYFMNDGFPKLKTWIRKWRCLKINFFQVEHLSSDWYLVGKECQSWFPKYCKFSKLR